MENVKDFQVNRDRIVLLLNDVIMLPGYCADSLRFERSSAELQTQGLSGHGHLGMCVVCVCGPSKWTKINTDRIKILSPVGSDISLIACLANQATEDSFDP